MRIYSYCLCLYRASANRCLSTSNSFFTRAGEIAIFPLWPMAGRAASRILVRATTQVATPARLLPGLILHEIDGRFSEAAEAVLRGAAALAL